MEILLRIMTRERSFFDQILLRPDIEVRPNGLVGIFEDKQVIPNLYNNSSLRRSFIRGLYYETVGRELVAIDEKVGSNEIGSHIAFYPIDFCHETAKRATLCAPEDLTKLIIRGMPNFYRSEEHIDAFQREILDPIRGVLMRTLYPTQDRQGQLSFDL